MKQQRATALAKAGKEDYQSVAADCIKICVKNNIDYKDLKKAEKIIRLKFTMLRLSQRLKALVNRKDVHQNNKNLFIRDVYDSVMVSHAIRQLIGRIFRKTPLVGRYLWLLFLRKG